MVNDKQNHLGKPVREILNNTRPRNLNMKKEKDNIKSNAMVFLKGRVIVYNALESGIFLLPRGNYSEQTEQPEQSEQLINYHQYISPESDNNSNKSNSK